MLTVSAACLGIVVGLEADVPTLEPAKHGTLVGLTREIVTFGRFATAVMPAVRLMTGLGMPTMIQNLSFACADLIKKTSYRDPPRRPRRRDSFVTAPGRQCQFRAAHPGQRSATGGTLRTWDRGGSAHVRPPRRRLCWRGWS